VGTLVTIHLPYGTISKFGSANEQEQFITANPDWDRRNPYEAMENNWLLIDNKAVTDLSGAPLTGVNQLLLTCGYGSSVGANGIVHQGNPVTGVTLANLIQPHIHAYVNSIEYNAAYLNLAAMGDPTNHLYGALDSPDVNHITPILPFYDFNDGTIMAGANATTITQNFNVVYNYDKEFSFSAPVNNTGAKVSITGNVNVTAHNAESVKVTAPIVGDLIITSDHAKKIYVNGDVTGTLTINASPGTEIYINDKWTTSVQYPGRYGTILISNVNESSKLTISNKTIINNLTLNCGVTVVNAGAINTLDISGTHQTVRLEGAYNNVGGAAATINLNTVATVINGNDDVDDTIAIIAKANIFAAGTPAADIPVDLLGNGGQYPSVTDAATLVTYIDSYASSNPVATETSLALGLDLYRAANVDLSQLENANAGGADGVALTNAMIATTTSLTTKDDIEAVISDMVAAFDDIRNATPVTTPALTDNHFERAGIVLGVKTSAAVQAAIESWLAPRTFESLQIFVDKL
jgi:hypothetical protein